jgi:5-methylthioribose kinase
MRLLGSGVFRQGYKVRGCDLVIKFPNPAVKDIDTENRQHSATEIRRIRRLRAAGTLEQFLPEVFYYDKKTGVVAMRYYKEFKNFEEQADAMGRMIQKLIYRIARVRCADIHTGNVRQRNSPPAHLKDAVLIDLGY